jgi:hypothetical protein
MFLATSLERVSHALKLVANTSVSVMSLNRGITDHQKTRNLSCLWDELKLKKTQVERAQYFVPKHDKGKLDMVQSFN